MRLALAQISPRVGDFQHNLALIREAYVRACKDGARILLTPELSLCGYPPHDLIERPEMPERCSAALAELATATKGQACALVVGAVTANPEATGRAVQNTAVVLEGGHEVFRQSKTLLPTYDVFDEARYFEPAREIRLWDCDGKRIALAICEDLWGDNPDMPRPLYTRDVLSEYRKQGAELVISISASPYEWGKRAHRENLHAQDAAQLGVPLVYLNQCGATDEILFDGSSFACDAQGKIQTRLATFEPAYAVLEWEGGAVRGDGELAEPLADLEELRRGIVMGIREYFQRSGFKKTILGLSGGIDSAVVCALSAEALGPSNVTGLAMPSQFSSPASLEDAETLARNLGIRFEVAPIKFLFSATAREFGQLRGGQLTSLTQENLQSRLRALTLMTLSNHDGSLMMSTSNKSELAVGYCTLYGDTIGALSPIGDVLKTRVYELAKILPAIPERSRTRAPSAELKPNQTDQDTLPPYEDLDAFLEAYIEREEPLATIEKRLGSRGKPGWIADTLKRIEQNEYKRRQAAPALKVSRKAFGIGRRVPIAKRWDV